jgi:hypothetical protein
MSYPVIQLNSNDKLLCKFDDLDATPKHFQYIITHCNSDWSTSSMSEQEYLDGFNNNPINTTSNSINTTVPYIHYEIELPNEDVKFKISGNYIIKVFDQDNDNQLVAAARFYVSEDLANIVSEVKQSEDPSTILTQQALYLKVKYNLPNVSFPQNEFKVFVAQNNDPLTLKANIKPYATQDGLLDFCSIEGIPFWGGNEYRKFDAKSVRYQTINVKSIVYFAPYYHYYLYPDEFASRKKYFYTEDIDGKYIVANDRGSTPDTDADYVLAHFSISAPVPYDGKLWVYGALTNWQTSDSTLMRYNYRDKEYQCALLLKQGYYNYKYVYQPNSKDEIDPVFPEYSFYETENNYLVWVYYQGISDRYERLIGFSFVSSMKKK